MVNESYVNICKVQDIRVYGRVCKSGRLGNPVSGNCSSHDSKYNYHRVESVSCVSRTDEMASYTSTPVK